MSTPLKKQIRDAINAGWQQPEDYFDRAYFNIEVAADAVELLFDLKPVSDYPSDAEIFQLACKLIDTASSDRMFFWLPVLSQLCDAVLKQAECVKERSK